MRSLGVVLAVAMAVAVPGIAAVNPSGSVPALTSDQLVYQGARVEMMVDVNGEAVVLLLGSVLDAAAETAHKLAASAKGQEGAVGSSPRSMVGGPIPLLAEQLIDPVKDAVKAVTRAALVVMEADEQVPADRFIAHYNELITSRGWSPLATVRSGSGEGLSLWLAPGGKGLFGAFRPDKKQLIVGLVTASAPLGDLIAQIVRASEPLVGQLLTGMLGARAGVPVREIGGSPQPATP